MSTKDHHQGIEPTLRQVRCGHCRLPLVQLYQGDLISTLQSGEGKAISQPLPAYAYRALTAPTPLLCCPLCSATLSPATVTVVHPGTLAPEEKATLRTNEL